MANSPQPSLRLNVDLGTPLAPVLGTPELKTLRQALTGDLNNLLGRLGLDGRGAALVRMTPSERCVRIRLQGRTVTYSPKLMRRAWVATAPSELRSFPVDPSRSPDFSFPDGWLGDYWVDPEASKSRAVQRDLVLAFLRRLVNLVLQESPACLVVPETAIAFWQSLMDGVEAEPDVFPVLQGLLDLWLPLDDRETVCQAIRQNREAGCAPEDAVEALFNRLHARRIEIHIHPDYLQQVLPGYPGWGPLSVYDPRLPADTSSLFEQVADGLYSRLGLRPPDIFWAPSRRVPEGAFQVKINAHLGAPIQGLQSGEMLVSATLEDLKKLNLTGRAARMPSNDEEAAITDLAHQQAVKDGGFESWPPLDYLILEFTDEVNQNAARLFGIEEAEYELAQLEEGFPDLVLPVLARTSLGDITRLLRGLLREGVSIQNLPVIVERLLSFATVPIDASRYIVMDERLPVPEWVEGPAVNAWPNQLEYVRMGLGNQLVEKYQGTLRGLSVFLASPEVEKRLESMLRRASVARSDPSDRAPVDLNPAQEAWLERFRDNVWEELQTAGRDMGRTPLLTVSGLRAPLRGWLAGELPGLPVLSYSEIPADVNITPISRIMG